MTRKKIVYLIYLVEVLYVAAIIYTIVGSPMKSLTSLWQLAFCGITFIVVVCFPLWLAEKVSSWADHKWPPPQDSLSAEQIIAIASRKFAKTIFTLFVIGYIGLVVKDCSHLHFDFKIYDDRHSCYLDINKL